MNVKVQSLCQDEKKQKHLKSLHFHMQQFRGPGKTSQKVKKPTIAISDGAVLIVTLVWSRAAQALAPRVDYWNLRFIWNLVLGIWDFTRFRRRGIK